MRLIVERIPEIKKYLGSIHLIPKASFSCCGEPQFLTELSLLKRKQIIVCGIEAHVCVMQTVLDLIENQYKVQVVYDAVSSRKQVNKDIAIERMKLVEADITTTEMLATELLTTARHEKFKSILSLMK